MFQDIKIPHYAEENLLQDIGFTECRFSLLQQGVYSLHLMPIFKTLLNHLPALLKVKVVNFCYKSVH